LQQKRDLPLGFFGIRGFEDASRLAASADGDLGYEHDRPIDIQGVVRANQPPRR
jgi:hypothetical protein